MSRLLASYEAKHFLWETSGHVATLTLSRPERKNPLTFDSYAELRDVFRALADAADIKAIVITGAGGNFCSGGDVKDIIGPLTGKPPQGLREFTQMTGDLVAAMMHCPQPVIAAVDGVCAGAGAAIAMASDLRLATVTTQTAFLFVRVGLAGCDMGACAILPRIIGQGRAAELLYTGRAMSAQEGLAWGFYNRLVESSVLLTEARSLAEQLANGPTLAHRVTKKMLYEEWTLTLDQALQAEAEAQAALMQSGDFRRAYAAFIAKRKPVFEGN